MKYMTNTLAAAALILAPAALLAEPMADKPAAADAVTEKVEKAAMTKEKAADIEITVTCNDTMQFDKKAIELAVGKTVKLTLKNTGKLPKTAMGHNLVILKKDANLMGWAQKAMTARATDFIPADAESKSAILAHTKLLGPDEEDSITFTATEAGDYEFLCSFPGHFALMKGKITVK